MDVSTCFIPRAGKSALSGLAPASERLGGGGRADPADTGGTKAGSREARLDRLGEDVMSGS